MLVPPLVERELANRIAAEFVVHPARNLNASETADRRALVFDVGMDRPALGLKAKNGWKHVLLPPM